VELRREFEAIMLTVNTALREPGIEGSIAAAMDRISDERASELAHSIVSLYDAFLRAHRLDD
jgi:hypothetical protein